VLADMLQIAYSAMTMGSIYALVALGLVLIFKATDLVNFGQGEWVLAGAYVSLTFVLWGLPLWVVFIIAPLVGAGLGAIIDTTVFRRVAKSGGWIFVVSSIAVGGLLGELAHYRYESNIYRFPTFFSRDSFSLFGAFTSMHNIFVVAFTAFIIVCVYLFFEHTRIGRATKGVAENRTGASVVGINVRAVLTLVFALSFVISTFAGMLVGPQIGVSPDMWFVIIKGFVAAALGGLTRLYGAVAAGFLVAVAEALTNIYLTSTYRDVIVFSVLLVALWYRPSGLFEREVVKRV
jgi:branched-chain amino acid transport system permease protein